MSRIVIHLHLYYLDQTDMLIKKLINVKKLCPSDLIITMHDKNLNIESKIKKHFPNAKIILVKNIGADIWPFIVMLNSINLEDYDYIIKIHTKRFLQSKKWRMPETNFKMYGTKWRDYLLEFLEPENFKKCIENFIIDKNLGMVSSYPVIIKDSEKHGEDIPTYLKTRALLNNHKYKTKISFVAGTMFMARARLFNMVKSLNLQESDFEQFESGKSNQLPHVMERFFGGCVLAQGYKIKDVFTSKIKIKIHNLTINPYLLSKKILGKVIKTITRFFIKTKHDDVSHRVIGIRIMKIWIWRDSK